MAVGRLIRFAVANSSANSAHNVVHGSRLTQRF